MNDTNWRDAVKLATHYKAIGEARIYLSGHEHGLDMPWEWARFKDNDCGSHRFNVKVTLAFEAAHPCGLTFAWSVDIEDRDANGAESLRPAIGRLREVVGLVPASERDGIALALGRVATAMDAHADEYEAFASRQHGIARALRDVVRPAPGEADRG